MVNAQEWLDKEYPLEKKITITNLNINNKDLEGKLELTNFFNLQKLNCSSNNLTELVLSDCRNLIELRCYATPLTNTDFLSTLPNPQKLTLLDIGDNDFVEQDLGVLKRFTNLECLYYWTTNQKRIDKGLYNRFCGSLKHLEKMKNLKKLGITNTDVDSGLEYLAESKLESIASRWYTWGNNDKFGERKGAKSEKLFTELLPYAIDLRKGKYDLSAWKNSRLLSLISNQEKLQEQVFYQKKKIEVLNDELNSLIEEKLTIKKKELEKIINEIKGKLDEKLWGYLDILLLMSDKSEVSERAKKNLANQVNGDDLQKIIFLQHEINHLEKKINGVQQVAQVEVLPPAYH